jgi:hypothetical protein
LPFERVRANIGGGGGGDIDLSGGVSYIIPLVYCFDNFSKEPFVCSGNGKCIETDNCECSSAYGGKDCSLPKCFDQLSTNSTVCSGNGRCIAPNTCQCSSRLWVGKEVEGKYVDNCGGYIVPRLMVIVFYSFLSIILIPNCIMIILDLKHYQMHKKRHIYDKYKESMLGDTEIELTKKLIN